MHVLPCYKWIWSYLPLWTLTYLHSNSHASLFFGFPHAQNPTIQTQDPRFWHFHLLWTLCLEFTPTRHQAMLNSFLGEPENFPFFTVLPFQLTSEATSLIRNCICVCVCVCVYVCVNASVCVCVCINASVCVLVCTIHLLIIHKVTMCVYLLFVHGGLKPLPSLQLSWSSQPSTGHRCFQSRPAWLLT